MPRKSDNLWGLITELAGVVAYLTVLFIFAAAAVR